LGHTENPIEDRDDYGVSDDNWVPDPMDAGPGRAYFQITYYSYYKSSMYRSADITNLLVSLFDTTDVITEEIQNQMASCLLSKLDYDTGREAKMAPTEVMIKDIADSKRIDTNIYNEISISKAVGLENVKEVHVELELQDRTLEFEVAPIYATIIYHFQEQDTWDLRSLADKMNIDPSKLKGKIGFWEDRGVLKLIENDKWIVLEVAEAYH
ncbi:18933_t:CDS:2, partial [Racocetra fulgida]